MNAMPRLSKYSGEAQLKSRHRLTGGSATWNVRAPHVRLLPPARFIAYPLIQNIFNRIYPVLSQSTRAKMPPKATTTKRPTPAGSKPSGPATNAGRPAGTTARPRPTAGPSKPRIPQRAGASASGSGSQAKPQVDVKPTVNVGEEEWARLMKETYGGKQSAEWYAKGAKSVEVSRV